MQVIPDFLLPVGSLVELLLGVIAVLTLRSPGSAVVIPGCRPSISRQPRPAVKHQ